MNSNNVSDYRKTIQVILFFILLLNMASFKSIWISIAVILIALVLHAVKLKDIPKDKRIGASAPILLGLGMVLILFLLYKRF